MSAIGPLSSPPPSSLGDLTKSATSSPQDTKVRFVLSSLFSAGTQRTPKERTLDFKPSRLTSKSALKTYFKNNNSKITARTDAIGKVVLAGDLDAIDNLFNLIKGLKINSKEKQKLSAEILDIVTSFVSHDLMGTQKFNKMNAKWAELATCSDKDSGVEVSPPQTPVDKEIHLSPRAAKILESLRSLKKEEIKKTIQELQKCTLSEQLLLAAELRSKVNMMNLSAKLSKQELIELPPVLKGESLLKELKVTLKNGDSALSKAIIKELSTQNSDQLSKVFEPILAIIQSKLSESTEEINLDKGILFLQEQISDLSKKSQEEKLVILRSIVELAFDFENGTNHYDLNSEIEFSNKDLMYIDRLNVARGLLNGFWIHTNDEMTKALFHVDFLAILLGEEVVGDERVKVVKQQHSSTIYESKQGTVIQLPAKVIFDMVANFEDAKADEFHHSSRFVLDIERKTISFPNDSEKSLGKPLETDQTVWANEIHEKLKTLSPRDHVNIEKSLVQTTQKASSTYLSKYYIPLQLENPNGTVKINRFKFENFPSIRIEKHKDKLLVINSMAFFVYIEEEKVGRVLYTENVYVANEEGPGSFYFLEYGSMDAPKEVMEADNLSLAAMKHQPTVVAQIKEAIESPDSPLSFVKNL